MPRFTPANAREMAARSVAARKRTPAEMTTSLASLAPIPLPATAEAETDPGVNVACVRERLQTLDGMMAKAKGDSREWDNLTRAFDRMFRIWCVLTNTPGPGNRKPGPLRTSSPTWRSEPLPPQPDAVHALSGLVDEQQDGRAC
jgi:hypothetical protein